MKKILSALLAIAMLCGIAAAPVGAEEITVCVWNCGMVIILLLLIRGEDFFQN